MSEHPQHPTQRSAFQAPRTVAILVISALGAIGLLMQFQTVSLLTGAGLLWVGAALAAGGAVVAFATKVPTALKVATVLILVLCVANVAYTEHQLDQRRQEIQKVLDNWPHP